MGETGCAGTHKRERNFFIRRLQDFARTHTVRITILGGDVHLAAVGRFFSKDKLKIPAVSNILLSLTRRRLLSSLQNKDPRYMINAISSAITNAGPPMAVANVLDRRNKMHHFVSVVISSIIKQFLLTMLLRTPRRART